MSFAVWAGNGSTGRRGRVIQHHHEDQSSPGRRKKMRNLWLQWPSGRSDLRHPVHRPASITRARRGGAPGSAAMGRKWAWWRTEQAISLPRLRGNLARGQAWNGGQAWNRRPSLEPRPASGQTWNGGQRWNGANKPGEAAKAGTMEIGAVITTAADSSSALGFPMGMTTPWTTGRTTPMTTAMAPTMEIRATRYVAHTTMAIGTPAGCGSAADCPVTHIPSHRGGDRDTPGHFSL